MSTPEKNSKKFKKAVFFPRFPHRSAVGLSLGRFVAPLSAQCRPGNASQARMQRFAIFPGTSTGEIKELI
jgi:hypothetical protein